MNASAQQDLAITQEVDTSIKLIDAGLAAVQSLDGANDFFHLPMLLLANGLERLMKSVICLHELDKEGSYQAAQKWPSGAEGHGLEKLRDYIIENCFSDEYLKLPAAVDDRNHLENDGVASRTLRMLSEFGRKSRYFNLNVVLGRRLSCESPDHLWSEMEMDLLRLEDDWEDLLIDPHRSADLHQRIATKIVVCIERLTRALVRLFTLGGLGSAAKRQTGIIQSFLFLRDDQLGTRAYDPSGRGC